MWINKQTDSCVWLFATIWTVAYKAPPSMGFSRQEYWKRLPCPPPGDPPNPGTEPRSPALQADFLPSEPPGKPMNTGVGSLSFLQGIFWSQESSWSLLHCGWILYQLSSQRSPRAFPPSASVPLYFLCPAAWCHLTLCSWGIPEEDRFASRLVKCFQPWRLCVESQFLGH